MQSICFVIECSAMAHPKRRAVAKLRLKKALNKFFFVVNRQKGATLDNALNLSSPSCHIVN